MAGTRKTPKNWIDAGLKALRSDGPAGLQAETLARAIGTTKGSFYWHFKDVPAFQAQVLDAWATDCLSRFTKTLDAGDTDVMRLRAVSAFRPSQLDMAVRGWAVQDKAAAKAVKRVDHSMLSTISDLLKAQDATHPDFPHLILAALFGTPKKGDHTETLIDLLLVLK